MWALAFQPLQGTYQEIGLALRSSRLPWEERCHVAPRASRRHGFFPEAVPLLQVQG